MLLGMIPTEYKDDILVRSEVATYDDIIQYCKCRVKYKRQKPLSELTRRPPNDTRINALDGTSKQSDEDPILSWTVRLFG